MIGGVISIAVGAFIMWATWSIYHRPTYEFWLLVMMASIFIGLGIMMFGEAWT